MSLMSKKNHLTFNLNKVKFTLSIVDRDCIFNQIDLKSKAQKKYRQEKDIFLIRTKNIQSYKFRVRKTFRVYKVHKTFRVLTY